MARPVWHQAFVADLVGGSTEPDVHATQLRPIAGDSERTCAYRRDLPGGGFVAIEVVPVRESWWRAPHFDGRLVVERRAAWREGGHPSPVIAQASGTTVEDVVQLLLPAALCNETIGAALLRLHPIAAANQNVFDAVAHYEMQ